MAGDIIPEWWAAWIGIGTLLALLVFLTDADALSCFPSAAAVRQESPQAWPSWTLRAPGHEGTKCWYASMRSTAPDHQTQKVQGEVKRGITDTLMQSMTNGSGSSLTPRQSRPTLCRELSPNFGDGRDQAAAA